MRCICASPWPSCGGGPLRRHGGDAQPEQIPYKETIRGSVEKIRGRHKKQSGGHGQFGDVLVEIRPLPRGSGFEFTEVIAGGAVPRQYIPSVEIGWSAEII